MNITELRVRDPYILVANGVYHLYKTDVCHVGTKILVYKSRDLVSWDEGKVVYTLTPTAWKECQFWAPEVHEWNGKYYIFVSVLGKNGLRGTEISVCDTPDGTFLPLSDVAVTPEDQSAIDGTLFCEDGIPYIVYSRDWPHCFDEEANAYVGEIWARALTKDLSAPSGEPFLLFRSTDCPLSAVAPARHSWEGKPVVRYGSDAPFLRRLSDGRILLTWSPIPENNYVVLGAVSDSLRGKWEHFDTPIFDRNGGHAMFFEDLEGNTRMCIHCPEKEGDERSMFLPVRISEGSVTLL